MRHKQDLYQEYIKYDQNLKIRRSIIGCILGITLVPAGAVVDWFLYPDFFLNFFNLRLLCSFLILGILSLHYTKIGRHNIRYLSFTWIILLQALLCWIIFTTDKYLSTYYASLNLVVLAASVILGFRTFEMVIFCIITLMLYLVSSFDASMSSPEILFNNIYFIILTFIIGITASYFNSQNRFREFCLNYELERKNKELAELDKIKSQFFANVSHEFRTPLTLILGPIQDILQNCEDNISAKIKSSLEIAQKNSFRLLKLVNNLLDITRLDEKKYQIKLEKIEINNVISGLVDSLSHLANSKKIKLIKNISNQETHILADIDAMEKLIMNLLTNAIKFTNSAGEISITTNCQNKNITISIQDNGIGISEENLPYIFDRFKQVDNSSTRKYQGSGLGLALVKELTILQNGIIKVESAPNKGTIFNITFPTIENLEKTPNATASNIEDESDLYSMTKIANRTIDIGNEDDFNANNILNNQIKTILIAEDEPDMMKYISSLFTDQNYNLLQAKTGTSALKMAYEYSPDLIILDLMLPEIDGLSICQKLKSDEKTKLIKILMLTARSDEKSKLTALKYGVDDFVNKPFSSNEIKARVNNILKSDKLQKDLYKELKDTIDKLVLAQNKLIQSEKINATGALPEEILHDVKNPLNYMVTALYSLKMDPAIANDCELTDTIKDIEDGIKRVNNIISDIRSFSNPKESDKTKFSLKSAVDNSLIFTKQDLQKVGVYLDIDDKLQVIASKEHITQVLINLIKNAAKAIDDSYQSHGKITIYAKKENENKATIVITDNGVGINEKDLKAIFNPFFTTRDIKKGIRLGLNTSYTIIKAHNSELKVKSKFGEGSSFYFELPIW